MTETATRLRAAATTDGYGDPVQDWAHATPVTFPVRAAEPRPSSEPAQNARNAVVDGFTLYLGGSVDITALDRVVFRGRTYNVLGDAADWRLHGRPRGTVVQLQGVAG